ncbi:RNA-binding S4 domain-containing protein [Haematomicrobium sanguinis]|uniref:RNA-binding S4 domain-containing protein n=1 Tax=Haematomicrobium sanguinis TaxID=479106 RepID=UPI000478D4A5|nr:RNA-binding S4 domain-containing protein [Haematomicrobium sanguinis]
MEEIEIRDDTIRLGQVLKLANLVEDGVEAKAVIAEGQVQVDGEVVTQRGKQVRPGQTVTVLGAGSVMVRAEH